MTVKTLCAEKHTVQILYCSFVWTFYTVIVTSFSHFCNFVLYFCAREQKYSIINAQNCWSHEIILAWTLYYITSL